MKKSRLIGVLLILIVIAILGVGCSKASTEPLDTEQETADKTDTEVIVKVDITEDLVYLELPESVVGDTSTFTEEEYLKDKDYIETAEKIEGGLRLGVTPENHIIMIDDLKLWLESTILVLVQEVDYIEDIVLNIAYDGMDIIVKEVGHNIDEVILTLTGMLEYVMIFEGREVDIEITVIGPDGKIEMVEQYKN